MEEIKSPAEAGIGLLVLPVVGRHLRWYEWLGPRFIGERVKG